MDAKTLEYMETRVNVAKRLTRKIKLINENIDQLSGEGSLTLSYPDISNRISLTSEFGSDDIFNMLAEDIVVGLKKELKKLITELDEL